jgi:hypothetical protein
MVGLRQHLIQLRPSLRKKQKHSPSREQLDKLSRTIKRWRIQNHMSAQLEKISGQLFELVRLDYLNVPFA